MWYDIIDSSFRSGDGNTYRVTVKSNTHFEHPDDVIAETLPLIKDEAITITCDGELLLDKLHNTRAVVRFWVERSMATEEQINYIFADTSAITVCTIYRSGVAIYNGFLDSGDIDIYDDNSGHFVLELVFGDLTPLKRIKANILGNETNRSTLRRTILNEFKVHDSNMPINGLFVNLTTRLLAPMGREEVTFATRLAGEDASLYDVLECYAESQCGSIRQVDGVLTLLQAPLKALQPRAYSPLVGIVKGINKARGKAFNKFVYKLKGADTVTNEYKAASVNGKAFFYPVDKPYLSTDKVASSDNYYNRVSHSESSYPIVSKRFVAPVASSPGSEMFILGKVSADEFTFPIMRLVEEQKRYRQMAIDLKAEIDKWSNSSPKVWNDTFRVAANCYRLDAQEHLLYHLMFASGGDYAITHLNNYYRSIVKVKECDRELVDDDSKLYDDKTEVDTMATLLSPYVQKCNDIIKGQDKDFTKLIPECTGFAYRKDSMSKWVPNLLIDNGVDVLGFDGRGLAVTKEITPIGIAGTPIDITISGGVYTSAKEVRDLLDELSKSLSVDDKQLVMAYQVGIYAVNSSTADVVYWVDNFGTEKSKYDRTTSGKRFSWKPFTTDMMTKAVSYVEMGGAFDQQQQGTITITTPPSGYDKIYIELTGKWVAGLKMDESTAASYFLNDIINPRMNLVKEMTGVYNSKFNSYSVVRYISSMRVEQGEKVAYKDRQAVLQLGGGDMMFDEVCEYETRIGTAVEPSVLMLSNGDVVKSLIDESWYAPINAHYSKIATHEAFTLYSLAILYRQRYEELEFKVIDFVGGYYGHLTSAFRLPVNDDKVYFPTHYEWRVQSGTATVRGRLLPQHDDVQLMEKAKRASDEMAVGNFEFGGGAGSTDKGTLTTASGRTIGR